MKEAFEKILIVMFENQYRSYVMQDDFMKKLALAGASMNNYFGVFHPSQTNYIASLAGEVCAVTNDVPPASPLLQKTLVDLFEESGVSWKAYMEGYPGEAWNPAWQKSNYKASLQPMCEYPSDGKSLARYFRKHNAFASFYNIQSVKKRWANILSDQDFWKDVHNESLPLYSWFTPDIWNDGHYIYNTHVDSNPRTQLIPQVSNWLEYVFFANLKKDKIQGGAQIGLPNIGLNLDFDLLFTDPQRAWAESNVPKGTLIVITFDEADFDAVGFDTSYDGSNQVYTVLLGDMIEPGANIDVPFNHYSVIKTVEKNFSLADLNKNDTKANWFRFLWNKKFTWSTSSASDISQKKELALTSMNNVYHLIALSNEGSLDAYRYTNGKLDKGEKLTFQGVTNIALASIGGELILVYVDDSRKMNFLNGNGEGAWSEPTVLGSNNSYGDITMTKYFDDADQKQKLMLCWRNKSGFIKYRIYSDGRWDKKARNVNQLTDGSMALCQLGPSLYLVYKERNTRKMRFTSYNLATYNAFEALSFNNKADPVNNTSLHTWSPADMPVGNFAKKMNSVQNIYMSIGKIRLAAIEGEMHMIHRGAFDDTPEGKTSYFGLTGVFTAAHQLTKGYGTIDQAGWTDEQTLPDIQLNPESPIAMSSDGEQILVIWQDKDTDMLNFIRGAYN